MVRGQERTIQGNVFEAGKFMRARARTVSKPDREPSRRIEAILSNPQHDKYSVNLDFLRAVAVICVFISHYPQYGAHHDLSLGRLGNLGVILFFVHTCFVLMDSLRRLEKARGTDVGLARIFWIRRFFRIYPLAILCVLFVAIFRIPAYPGELYSPVGVKTVISNLALIQNITQSPISLGVLWSLPLEVQMYLILPFAYLGIRRDRRFGSFAFLLIAILLGGFALMLSSGNPALIFGLGVLIYAPCFTSGIVAFNFIESKTWKWVLPAWVWPVGVLAAILAYGPIGLDVPTIRAWGVALFVGLLYANVHEGKPDWIHKIFHWIAQHSYGIYLSHSIVLWFVFYRMGNFPFWIRISALVAGVVGIPALLYVAVEKPMIQLGARLANQIFKRPAVNSESQPA
jgi:peptidoglycan/LPS O-acetylase OafA/YrhL